MASDAPAPLRVRVALVVAGIAVAIAASVALAGWLRERESVNVRVVGGSAPEPNWRHYEVLTPDPVAGFRPKRGIETSFPMAAVDGSGRVVIRKRRGAHGFLRDDELPAASGVQQALYDWFVDRLRARGAHVVDMLPAFRANGTLDIYAIDFHIFVRGHRLVAEQVLPVLRPLLR